MEIFDEMSGRKIGVIEGAIVAAGAVGALLAGALAIRDLNANLSLEEIAFLISLSVFFSGVLVHIWSAQRSIGEIGDKLDRLVGDEPIRQFLRDGEIRADHSAQGAVIENGRTVLIDAVSKINQDINTLEDAHKNNRMTICNIPSVYNFMHQLVGGLPENSVYLATTKFDSYGEKMPPELFNFSRTLETRARSQELFVARLYYAIDESPNGQPAQLDEQRAEEISVAENAGILARYALVSSARFNSNSDVRDLAFVLNPPDKPLSREEVIAILNGDANIFAALKALGFSEVCAICYTVSSSGDSYGTSIDSMELLFDMSDKDCVSYRQEFELYWHENKQVSHDA